MRWLTGGPAAWGVQVIPGAGGQMGDLLSRTACSENFLYGIDRSGPADHGPSGQGLKRVSLELGGKSPNIVFADADLEMAAETSPMSVFANTGQDCCASSRVFVERSMFDQLWNGFAATEKLRVGLPGKPKRKLVRWSPRISASRWKVISGKRGGRSRMACGGGRPVRRVFFLNPTVLLGVGNGGPRWREEIFGPVVCIRRFEEEEAMLGEVNDSPYGLSGSIWTNDLRRALRVARRVESGVLSINSHSSVHVEAPFGGFKQSGGAGSGHGGDGGLYGAEEHLHRGS